MLVVGLIDIQHMQSVIKVFFFFFSKIATILVIWKPSDRETRVKIKFFTIHWKFYGPNAGPQDWTSNQPYLPVSGGGGQCCSVSYEQKLTKILTREQDRLLVKVTRPARATDIAIEVFNNSH